MKKSCALDSFCFLILFLAILSSSCSPSNSSGLKESILPCMEERKTTEELKDETGTVIFIAQTFMIDAGNNTRFDPCNLPEEFKKEGIRIIYSGDVKRILPNERRAGTPLSLRHVSLQ